MPHVVKIFAAIEIPSVKLLGQCLWNCPASLPQPGKDPHILHAELHGVGFDEPYQDGNPEEETSWESGVGLQGSAPPRKCHNKGYGAQVAATRKHQTAFRFKAMLP
eukprot:g19065.t1